MNTPTLRCWCANQRSLKSNPNAEVTKNTVVASSGSWMTPKLTLAKMIKFYVQETTFGNKSLIFDPDVWLLTQRLMDDGRRRTGSFLKLTLSFLFGPNFSRHSSSDRLKFHRNSSDPPFLSVLARRLFVLRLRREENVSVSAASTTQTPSER